MADPAVIPATTPVALTLAMAALLLLHVPPVVALVNVMVEPAHTVDGPLMMPAVGVRFTVSDVVLIAEPHEVVRM